MSRARLFTSAPVSGSTFGPSCTEVTDRSLCRKWCTRDCLRPISRIGRPPPVLRPVHIDRHSAPPGKTLVFGFINIRSLTNKIDDLLETGRDLSLDVTLIADMAWHRVCLPWPSACRRLSGGRPAKAASCVRTRQDASASWWTRQDASGRIRTRPRPDGHHQDQPRWPGGCLSSGCWSEATRDRCEADVVRAALCSRHVRVVFVFRRSHLPTESEERSRDGPDPNEWKLGDVPSHRVVTFVDPLMSVTSTFISSAPTSPCLDSSLRCSALTVSPAVFHRRPWRDAGCGGIQRGSTGFDGWRRRYRSLRSPPASLVDIACSSASGVHTSVSRRPWRRLDMEAFRAGLRSSWCRSRLSHTDGGRLIRGSTTSVLRRSGKSAGWSVPLGKSIDGAATAEWYAARRGYRSLLRRKRKEFWRTKIDAESSTPRQLWKSIDALMCRGSAFEPSTIGPTDFHQFFDAKVAGVRASTADAPSPTFTAVDPGWSFTHFEDVAAAIGQAVLEWSRCDSLREEGSRCSGAVLHRAVQQVVVHRIGSFVVQGGIRLLAWILPMSVLTGQSVGDVEAVGASGCEAAGGLTSVRPASETAVGLPCSSLDRKWRS